MKVFWLFILLFCCGQFLYASDTIIVHKDSRLDILTQKQIIINKRSSMLTSTGQYKGFRLQIISTREREKAFNIKAELLTKYPEEKSYVLFQSPYFRVRIGNFVKREDAEKFRKILNKTYKNGVFIVEDVIDYIPPPDEEF
ncbi:MAG TPA: SPOR domain-containing protein [Chitinophagaceae bacterium]|nr:SPOR domain-containing protein [Chitinophagaceae bacterium]MCC6635157.1 SPOR domain-containing protein [Chitinophagaceae bacterium]HMZ45913.1 SPOR domain-containing protein [Chitinophagaceae bacterium]HNF29000.1 SPOR domain-containing protein [Chitinophagaceae bacterium]HNL82270.1 SPOR domain-containing protein [Chitinophagaceae bacterium]